MVDLRIKEIVDKFVKRGWMVQWCESCRIWTVMCRCGINCCGGGCNCGSSRAAQSAQLELDRLIDQ